MSAESIEARTAELMSMQKIELARQVAQWEESFAAALAPAIGQGTDPDITDVAPASTTPEVLDLETLEPIPAATEEGADAAEPEAQ